MYYRARRVYIYGQLVYSVGMVCMAISRHPAGVIIFSWTAGIMYATLFTMPYLLVARYHATETVRMTMIATIFKFFPVENVVCIEMFLLH